VAYARRQHTQPPPQHDGACWWHPTPRATPHKFESEWLDSTHINTSDQDRIPIAVFSALRQNRTALLQSREQSAGDGAQPASREQQPRRPRPWVCGGSLPPGPPPGSVSFQKRPSIKNFTPSELHTKDFTPHLPPAEEREAALAGLRLGHLLGALGLLGAPELGGASLLGFGGLGLGLEGVCVCKCVCVCWVGSGGGVRGWWGWCLFLWRVWMMASSCLTPALPNRHQHWSPPKIAPTQKPSQNDTGTGALPR